MTENVTTNAIGSVLLNDWDPLGVRNVPQAMDEYDRYIPALQIMISNGIADAELEHYLNEIQADEMGIVVMKDRSRTTAQRLLSLKRL